MFKLHKINPMVRAIGTMGAIVAIAGGITYAQLTSNTVKLTNNTLNANAQLQIWDSNAKTWGNTVPGFNFTGMVPGGQPSQTEYFSLKNTGNTPLAINVKFDQPPTFTVVDPSGSSSTGNFNVNLNQAFLTLHCVSGSTNFWLPKGASPVNFNQLSGNGVTLSGVLPAGQQANCSVDASLGGGIVGNQTVMTVETNGFNLDFTGVAS